MAKVSPLHRAIDAGRWDAERPLGRLIVVVHAAFLDAGFVALPRDGAGPVPRRAGRTASALSLQYTAPQLLQQQRIAEPAVLRLQARGRHVILHVDGDLRPVGERCVLVDALAAAPLLSGGLDATARALRSDARVAGLWSRLSGGLCRPALVDLCCRNGVALEPSFTSLPGDVTAAILARLADGADLARVECVCTGLRRLVAERDRELWKPLYEAPLRHMLWLPDGGRSPETSCKERYVRARRWQVSTPCLGSAPFSWLPGEFEVISSYLWSRVHPPPPFYGSPFLRRPVDRGDPPELPEDPVTDRRKLRAAARGKRAHQTPPPRGSENRRRGAGAIHAPSSRYRWNHR